MGSLADEPFVQFIFQHIHTSEERAHSGTPDILASSLVDQPSFGRNTPVYYNGASLLRSPLRNEASWSEIGSMRLFSRIQLPFTDREFSSQSVCPFGVGSYIGLPLLTL